MQTLSCPIPNNINPLQNNGFMFSILKLPELNYFCQEVTLPNIDSPAAEMDTPLVMNPMPGDKMTFGELSIQFLIDEDLTNYKALHNWMVSIGFPKSHEQYRNFINERTNSLTPSELNASYSDCVLAILNSSNRPASTIRYIDAFPTSLAQLTLQSTTSDTQYLAAQATFRYTYYQFD